jgi:hypothetical protein
MFALNIWWRQKSKKAVDDAIRVGGDSDKNFYVLPVVSKA